MEQRLHRPESLWYCFRCSCESEGIWNANVLLGKVGEEHGNPLKYFMITLEYAVMLGNSGFKTS